MFVSIDHRIAMRVGYRVWTSQNVLLATSPQDYEANALEQLTEMVANAVLSLCKNLAKLLQSS